MNRTTRHLLTGLLALGLALRPAPAPAAGVPVTTAAHDQYSPRIVTKPGGGAWLAWLDERSGYATDVYGAMLDAAGTPSTGGADQGVAFTDITCRKRDLVLAADGAGGAIAAWSDNRCTTPEGYDIFVLRLGADGRPAAGWPANGRNVSAAPDWQVQPAIAPDGSGGAFVAWVELSGFLPRVVAHHVLATGALDPAWPVPGITLAVAGSEAAAPVVGPDGAGGFYVAWGDSRDGDLDLRLQRVTGTGAIAGGWPAAAIEACAAPDEQFEPRLLAGVSGVSLAWLDRRADGLSRVYACRFLPNGQRAPGWTQDGVAVAPGDAAQHDLVVARADVGGYRFAWSEDRGLGSGRDVYAQRMDSTGAVAPGWPPGGALACAAPGSQHSPSFTPDGAGGAYYAWTDERDTLATGRDVFVQRLDAAGAVAAGWPANGFALCTDPGDQREVMLAGNGRGGAFGVWTDGRVPASAADIITREVAPEGPASVGVSGVAASHHDGQTFVRWTPPPGRGWKYRVYASGSPIASEGDLAAATLVGTAGDSSACDARLSVLLGSVVGFRTAEGEPELAPGGGLFVRTAMAPGAAWYAVTCTPGPLAEDRSIAPGVNALATPVAETTAMPRPVHQRTVTLPGRDVELWTLWTWHEDAPGFPAMANEPGLPFAFGLVRGQSSAAPLVVGFHARGGSLLDGAGGMGVPGEWVLAPDDRLPNGECTFWFGYHRTYDVRAAAGAPPLSGEVVGYTARRVDWTLDWVRRSFAIDTTRVFAFGYSMGGMGATQLAFRAPDRLAGAMSVIGQFDFSFQADPDPACWFNPGGPFRTLADQIWGPVSANLPVAGGAPVFELLNGTSVAAATDLPPLMAFNGRNDVNVGWAEKPRFWAAMQTHRRGGWFYWDNRVHGVAGASWIPMQAPAYLDRFRTNRSFPALSNGDSDGDPGDGTAASGDSVGTLNGHVEWDVPAEDTAGWGVTLTLRAITRTTGVVPAPESALVDVTPRRLQSFAFAPGEAVPYRVVRTADGALLARGQVVVDSSGALTVPAVRVHRDGTRVELGGPALLAAGPPAAPRALALACATPARAAELRARVDWPAAEESRLELLDVGGRRVATLFAGRPAPGPAGYDVPRGPLAPGLYFLRARCGAAEASRRVVVLR